MISRSSASTGAQRFLRLLQAVDVVHQHERAVHVAGRRRVGNHADGHPAPRAARARHQPIEGGRLALERARQHRLRAGVDAVADHVAQAHARHLLRGQSEILQERPVDVLAALVAVDVGDRCRDAVHDRAQLRFARGQRFLRFLQVGDVVADDVIALDRRVEVHVRDDLVAQPALATVDVVRLALVGHVLAARRAVDERLLELERFRAEHLLRRLADDPFAIEARPAAETRR